jgi:hypothetical protein
MPGRHNDGSLNRSFQEAHMSYFFRTVPYIVAGAHSLQSLEDSIQFVGNPRSILIVAQNAMKRIGVVSVSAVEAFWTFAASRC